MHFLPSFCPTIPLGVGSEWLKPGHLTHIVACRSLGKVVFFQATVANLGGQIAVSTPTSASYSPFPSPWSFHTGQFYWLRSRTIWNSRGRDIIMNAECSVHSDQLCSMCQWEQNIKHILEIQYRDTQLIWAGTIVLEGLKRASCDIEEDVESSFLRAPAEPQSQRSFPPGNQNLSKVTP